MQAPAPVHTRADLEAAARRFRASFLAANPDAVAVLAATYSEEGFAWSSADGAALAAAAAAAPAVSLTPRLPSHTLGTVLVMDAVAPPGPPGGRATAGAAAAAPAASPAPRSPAPRAFSPARAHRSASPGPGGAHPASPYRRGARPPAARAAAAARPAQQPGRAGPMRRLRRLLNALFSRRPPALD